MPDQITRDDVNTALSLVQKHLVTTPLVYSPEFSEAVGSEIYFKLESFQHPHSFKARGALKTELAKRYGAKVLLHGDTYDDALAHAQTLAREQGKELLPSFDDLKVIAGLPERSTPLHPGRLSLPRKGPCRQRTSSSPGPAAKSVMA